jgi:hypothetical protein
VGTGGTSNVSAVCSNSDKVVMFITQVGTVH